MIVKIVDDLSRDLLEELVQTFIQPADVRFEWAVSRGHASPFNV